MRLFRNHATTMAAFGITSGLLIATAQGCGDDGPLGNLAEQCGLVCPVEGVAQGNASISGVASVDAFFSSVISVRDAAANVSGTVRAELEGLAALLQIEGAADLTMDDLTAQVTAALEAKFQANIQGSLEVRFQEPRCEASIEASVSAAAECDVEADPGSIEASCMGSCEVSADVAAMCEAEGTLSCEGQAPNFDCMGTCSGSCELEVAASCEGTCNGSCEGTCTACAGGACDDMGGTTANCAGQCMGMCQGECRLDAGGDCSGRCEGSCEYTPPMGGCEANATAKCDVSAMADAQCSGKCEGNVEPPMVKAECQASVEAKAKAEVECTPPQLTVNFQFAANLDADARAEFKAFLEGFKARFSGMLAARAKLNIVGEAAAGLIVNATGAVQGAVEGSIDAVGSGDLSAAIGLGCALDELPLVQTALVDAQGDLTASVSAVTMVAGTVGG